METELIAAFHALVDATSGHARHFPEHIRARELLEKLQPATLPPNTPWGTPDVVTVIAPGIWFVSTPSHGGFYLSPERNKLVPMAWREATWNKHGLSGWYEEDCDSWLVVLWFQVGILADTDRQAKARDMFDASFKPKGLVPIPGPWRA